MPKMTLPIPMATSFMTSLQRPRVERLLPGQERVVDLDRAGPDLDGALDPSSGERRHRA